MLTLKLQEDTKVFFTSDTHFNHSSIIDYCHRPFKDVNEMNETLIKNWNSVVSSNDIVFHLGDIIFGGSTIWNSIIPRLNGRINLILGNHCHKNWREWYGKWFETVSEQLTIKINDTLCILTHYPLLCFPSNFINLFGHVHLLKSNNEGSDFERLDYLKPNQYDVGVDFNNFTPIEFKDVLKIIQNQIFLNKNTKELI